MKAQTKPTIFQPTADKPAYWMLDHRMTILISGEQTNNVYTILEMFIVPGGGPPLHINTERSETMIDKRHIVGALLTILTVLALSACGAAGSAGASQPDPSVGSIPTAAVVGAHEVTLVGRDHVFEAPEEVPAGQITFTFKNEGAAVHHVQVVRLNEGVTFDQLMAAFEQGETAALPLITPVGGPSLTDPGQTAQVTLNLEPGAYALLCLVPETEGIPHLAHGMARPLTITGDAATQPEPQVDLTVSMADFQYTLPNEVAAGPQTWKIVNNGPQPHELVLHKLAPGKTAENVIAFFHTPQDQPPFSNVGGMQGLPQGGEGWVHLDLAPGTYVAIYYIPDPTSGKRHMDIGMVRTLTVVEQR